MNGYLLDTHAFLWSVFEPERLSPAARTIAADQTYPVYVSSVTFWEIGFQTLALESDEAADFIDCHS